MADILAEQSSRDPIGVHQLVRGLNTILTPNRDVGETLDAIVQEASLAVNCEHLFLSRYDATNQMFRAVAWRSAINPGNVSLEQKFMGTSYLGNQPIIVNDLSQYNYRLRPAVARMGLLSMVGVPFATAGGVAGVLEAFAEDINHFSDLDVDCLLLFARQAASVMEKADLEREGRLRSAENDLLVEALKLEQASVGSLLYKVGEIFTSLFHADGIAVFGIETQVEGSPLQEVMAKGFAGSDVARLKELFNREYLDRLVNVPEGKEHNIIKQTLRHPGPGGARLLYTVPIVLKRALQGIVVFSWTKPDQESEMVNLEKFITRIIGSIIMILSRKTLYSNIQKISFSDTLTGLANRRLFDYVLDRELKKAKRSVKPLSLLMIDIDFFKKINDTFGHPVGDMILEQIGAMLKENCRNVDLPARYGGEEFVLVLPETDTANAAVIAERIRSRVAQQQFQIGSQYVNVTVSIGGATYIGSQDTGAGDSIVQIADQALYQAKQMGRNLVVFANKPKG
ncbi:MAG: sensor domain-containing diguanylate cyclase [Negativicutes bacterium]|nr:sensor domain-containing diguanylate cyclase [Negativicutes bacterium]